MLLLHLNIKNSQKDKRKPHKTSFSYYLGLGPGGLGGPGCHGGPGGPGGLGGPGCHGGPGGPGGRGGPGCHGGRGGKIVHQNQYGKKTPCRS